MQGKKLLLIMISVWMASPVAAFTFPYEYATKSLPKGWYLEGNAGVATLFDTAYSGSISPANVGVNGNIGYKFFPFFAAEIGYTHYPEFPIKNSAGVEAGVDDRHQAFDLVGKFILPLATSGVELFAKAGIAKVYSRIYIENTSVASSLGLESGTKTVTNAYYGLGGQYYFMPDVALNGQWNRAKGGGSTGKTDLYSAGLSVIFE